MSTPTKVETSQVEPKEIVLPESGWTFTLKTKFTSMDMIRLKKLVASGMSMTKGQNDDSVEMQFKVEEGISTEIQSVVAYTQSIRDEKGSERAVDVKTVTWFLENSDFGDYEILEEAIKKLDEELKARKKK